MKIGIFSDVHANIEAMMSVLVAYEQEEIDRFYCLGDVVGYGANPNECVDIVRKIAAVTILGNHDAAVGGRMDYSYYYDAAREALDYHKHLSTEDNLEWLRSLPYKHDVEDVDLTLCHGSPLRLEDFEYIFTPEQARECLTIWDDLRHVTLIGHSHLCRVFELRNDSDADVEELVPDQVTLDPNAKYIISVGSVGQPRDHDPRSSYTIYDTETHTFTFKRIEYDIQGAADKIFNSPLDPNFARRLFIGV